MKDIVNYHNDFNKIKLPTFTAQEQNILMGIICKIKDRKSNENIVFNSDELLEFSTENLTKKALGELIIILKEKFFKADFTILERVPELKVIKNTTFNLFSEFTVVTDEENGEKIVNVELGVNPRFAYLINDLTKHFLTFELKEFISLSSKYSKTLYRLLKQFRYTGALKMEWDNFREVMDIPKEYKQGKIDERILKPSIKELSAEKDLFNTKNPIFKNLTYKKIKDPKGRGRGGKVIGIEFTFTPETRDLDTYIPDHAESIARKVRKEQILNKNEKNKELVKKEKEPEFLETRTHIFTGKPVTDLNEFIGRHFFMKNKMDSGYDVCKIKSLYQESDGKIYGSAINQENLKIFEFKNGFESIEHLKNALLLD